MGQERKRLRRSPLRGPQAEALRGNKTALKCLVGGAFR